MIDFSTENFYGPCNGSEQFQCTDGCIFSKYVCDGDKDCTGGEDEENCLDYLNYFRSETSYKVSCSIDLSFSSIPIKYKIILVYFNAVNKISQFLAE